MIRKTGLALAVALMGATATVAIDHHGDKKDGMNYIAKAVHSDMRPEADTARDAMRKPHKVLKFAGVKPGMTVLDINSAGGYYTEILSGVVGDSGKVYAHNGPIYWSFMKETVPARYASDHLSNVEQLHNGSETIDMADGSLDLVFSALAYHDYYMSEAAVANPDMIVEVNKSVYNALKPGGAYVIIDHVAPEGSGYAAGNSMHRIDPALVKAQMEAAGFTLAETSDILANANDTKETGPFDPSIRGKTDRFIYKFVK